MPGTEQQYIPYKSKYTFEHRRREYEKISSKFVDMIPIIIEKDSKSTIQMIDRHKFLLPKDITVGQFVYMIRRRVRLNPDEALFIFINNTLPTMSMLLSQLYNEHKDTDGFIYIKYSGENTFG